ncbi:MAG TPA: response regulator transcription factor [Propionicimonas sp.]|nr:response regulator transcription factor [Propionicimonas sp.]HQD97115.1 response regulator transcription factor [Propionicimonas sp.]
MKAQIGMVDDHPAIMLGVGAILNAQPDLHVVAAAASVQELIAQTQRLDCVLLDLRLADGSTPTANLAALTALAIPVLVYTSGDRSDLIREATRAGATGVLRKSEPPDVVVGAIRSLLRGEPVVTAEWAAALDFDPDFATVHLSPREAEVLTLYASGETAERVAALLFISRETVHDHVRRIRAKYAAADRPALTKVDLYRRAVEDGLVPQGHDHS